MSKLLGRRRGIEEANAAVQGRFTETLAAWQERKLAHKQQGEIRRLVVAEGIYLDVEVMSQFLEECLQEIVWPRETAVSFDIVKPGTRVLVDVDLPEIEDMPSRQAAVPARGLKLSVKSLTANKIQRLYMDHVHGLAFRVLGEVFAALPVAETVLLSAYSQWLDPATGQQRDDYLLSVSVQRQEWEKIDFKNLDAIDVVEVLSTFDLRRNLSKTGLFKPVVPFDA